MYVCRGEGQKEIFQSLLLLFLADFSLAAITGYSGTAGIPSDGSSAPPHTVRSEHLGELEKETDQSSQIAQ